MPEEPDSGLDLPAVERVLREEQAELRDRMAQLSKPPERASQVSFGKRIGDGTTEAISRLTEVGVFSTLQESERHVGRALEKIADGTYGVCDSCGEQIPEGRLRAVPHSTQCVTCAAKGRAG